MRRAAFALIAVGACAFAYACDSFEEAGTTPVSPDAESDAAAPDVSTPDTAVDGTAGCTAGEPEWAVPGGSVPSIVTCGSATGVELLTSASHCGRCDHSCGSGGTCVDGMCAPRMEDSTTSVLEKIADGVVYYVRRPSGSGQEIARHVPGSPNVVLGKLDGDAGLDREVRSMAVGADFVYVRTRTKLRRTSKTTESTSEPALVASLSEEEIASVAIAPDGNLVVSAKTLNRFDSVTPTGIRSSYLEPAAFPLESAFAGNRFVWLTQPFLFFLGTGNSVLHLRDGTTNRTLLDSTDWLGGIVIDGNEVVLARNSENGGSVLAIDLTTGAQRSYFDGPLDNAFYQLSVAVDATHVYWVKSLEKAIGARSEIWKRARCGGAAVRIASRPYINRIAMLGDRLYFGAQDGLFSFAK